MVTTQYPTTIPTTNQCPTALQDNIDDVLADQQNAPHAEILAICAELGTLPKGAYASVKARLQQFSDWLDQAVKQASSPTFAAGTNIATINLSGGQILFPSTQVPSANANTVDDFEKGVWTPSITFGGASVGQTYNTRIGRFVKIGDMVWANCYIRLTAKGSSVGEAFVAGLPFANSPTSFNPACLWFLSVTFANQLIGYMNPGEALVKLQEQTEGGALTTLSEGDFVNTSRVAVFIVYHTTP